MSSDPPVEPTSSSPLKHARSGEPGCRPGCQLFTLPGLAEPLGRLESALQFKNRLRRYAKRRWWYAQNTIRETLHLQQGEKNNPMNRKDELLPGDDVFILSEEEIRKTLNRWNGLRGCVFMEEMWAFCGTKQRVLKRVNTFLDERDYKMKKCKNTFILEGVMCNGTKDFGVCDRSCFFFWRQEWLRKADTQEPGAPSTDIGKRA
jgi:hypothetical protein